MIHDHHFYVIHRACWPSAIMETITEQAEDELLTQKATKKSVTSTGACICTTIYTYCMCMGQQTGRKLFCRCYLLQG